MSSVRNSSVSKLPFFPTFPPKDKFHPIYPLTWENCATLTDQRYALSAGTINTIMGCTTHCNSSLRNLFRSSASKNRGRTGGQFFARVTFLQLFQHLFPGILYRFPVIFIPRMVFANERTRRTSAVTPEPYIFPNALVIFSIVPDFCVV